MVVNLIWPYKRNKIVAEMGVNLTVWNPRHKQSMGLCFRRQKMMRAITKSNRADVIITS